MARSLTPKDAHTIMNLLVNEATGGASTTTVVDSSTFVSAGEEVLASGVENTLNALSLVLGRTFMAVRPYDAKLAIINALDTGAYTSRIRKISFYAKDAQASGDWNTQLYNANLADGADNGSGSGNATASMWEQNQPLPVEMNFAGQSVWEDSITIYQNQLKTAFRSEEEFIAFVSGIMTEKGNDIESQKEAFNRMTLLNRIAGTIAMGDKCPGSVINLTAEFNKEFGTQYTTAQLLSTYLEQFLKFFVARFKLASDQLELRSTLYHWTPSAEHKLMRHTPKSKQRAILYKPFMTKSEAMVMPAIFNPQYLDISNYEGVTYWQNINVPSEINVLPAIPNTTTPTAGQTAPEAAVNVPYVLGCLYDEDALMVDYQLESSLATPIEARKRYHNIWWTFSKNAINDFTENFIVFTMQDA